MSEEKGDWAYQVSLLPWNTITTDKKEALLLKFLCTPQSTCLLLLDPSDMSMWSERLSEEVLAARATTLNPSLEFSKELFTALLTDTILRKPNAIKQNDLTVFSWEKGDAASVFTRDEAVLSFQKSAVGNYKWKFKLSRSELGGEVLAQHLVQPMAALINVLVTERDDLIEVVKAKSEDIHNAKKLLGEIDRKKFRSSKFDGKAFRAVCFEKTMKSDGFRRPIERLLGAEGDFQARYSDMQNGIQTAHAHPAPIIMETPSGNLAFSDPVAAPVRSAFKRGAVSSTLPRRSSVQIHDSVPPSAMIGEVIPFAETVDIQVPNASHDNAEVVAEVAPALQTDLVGLAEENETQSQAVVQDVKLPTSRPKKRKKRNIN